LDICHPSYRKSVSNEIVLRETMSAGDGGLKATLPMIGPFGVGPESFIQKKVDPIINLCYQCYKAGQRKAPAGRRVREFLWQGCLWLASKRPRKDRQLPPGAESSAPCGSFCIRWRGFRQRGSR
jgi:hypothetical protein